MNGLVTIGDDSGHELQQVACLVTNERAPTIRVYHHPSTWEACRCRTCARVLAQLDWSAFTDHMDHFVSAHFDGGTFAIDVSDIPLTSWSLFVAELVLHCAIDYTKNEGEISYDLDQLLHVACKAAWVWIIVMFPALSR